MPNAPKQYRPKWAAQASRASAKEAKQARGGDFYSSKPWRKLRAHKLTSQPLCEWCLEVGLVTAADTVDHRIPRRLRPDLAMDWGNLRSCCGSCHGKYGATATRPEAKR
jgi:5-methylcytosine-specific restriction endonuclease McrA